MLAMPGPAAPEGRSGSQQNRSPRRGTGSTAFRDWPPAPVAVASRQRMRLCRRRRSRGRCAPRPALRVLEPWRCSSTALSDLWRTSTFRPWADSRATAFLSEYCSAFCF
jgi:hypothetical protein